MHHLPIAACHLVRVVGSYSARGCPSVGFIVRHEQERRREHRSALEDSPESKSDSLERLAGWEPPPTRQGQIDSMRRKTALASVSVETRPSVASYNGRCDYPRIEHQRKARQCRPFLLRTRPPITGWSSPKTSGERRLHADARCPPVHSDRSGDPGGVEQAAEAAVGSRSTRSGE